MTRLPLYQCHKQVRALKLFQVCEQTDGSVLLLPVDPSHDPIERSAEYAERIHRADDDAGYFVVYENGYESWSPTQAFERGYTRIDE